MDKIQRGIVPSEMSGRFERRGQNRIREKKNAKPGISPVADSGPETNRPPIVPAPVILNHLHIQVDPKNIKRKLPGHWEESSPSRRERAAHMPGEATFRDIRSSE